LTAARTHDVPPVTRFCLAPSERASLALIPARQLPTTASANVGLIYWLHVLLSYIILSKNGCKCHSLLAKNESPFASRRLRPTSSNFMRKGERTLGSFMLLRVDDRAIPIPVSFAYETAKY
jgi:hypothetical protein